MTTTDFGIKGFERGNTQSLIWRPWITGYENGFQELTTALVQGGALQPGVFVIPMVNIVEHTGRSDILGLQSNTQAHGPANGL